MKLLGYVVCNQSGSTVKMTSSLRSALYHAKRNDGEIWADYGTGCMVEDSVIIWENGRGLPIYERHTDVEYAVG